MSAPGMYPAFVLRPEYQSLDGLRGCSLPLGMLMLSELTATARRTRGCAQTLTSNRVAITRSDICFLFVVLSATVYSHVEFLSRRAPFAVITRSDQPRSTTSVALKQSRPCGRARRICRCEPQIATLELRESWNSSARGCTPASCSHCRTYVVTVMSNIYVDISGPCIHTKLVESTISRITCMAPGLKRPYVSIAKRRKAWPGQLWSDLRPTRLKPE